MCGRLKRIKRKKIRKIQYKKIPLNSKSGELYYDGPPRQSSRCVSYTVFGPTTGHKTVALKSK